MLKRWWYKWSLHQKAFFVGLVFTFFVAVSAALVSYQMYSRTMDRYYRTLSENVAQTAISILDAEQVEEYTEQVTDIYLENPAPEFADEEEEAAYLRQYDFIWDETYEQMFETLEKIKTANNVLSLYIIHVDSASKTCVYIVDGDPTENACLPGTWDIIYEQNYGIFENPEQGFPTYITNTEEFGWLCTTGVPVFNADGEVIAYVMVDISMDSMMRQRYVYMAWMCVIICGVALIMLMFFLYMVKVTLERPVNALANAALSFIEDREDREKRGAGGSLLEELHVHTGDELEYLADSMKQMAKDINLFIDNLAAVTAEKERIGAELDIATHIQAAMLPCIFPAFPDRKEFDLFASMNPAKEVGGDFYDLFMVDERHLAIVIADVSGKGVPAALFMVIGKTLIKDHTQPGVNLGDVFYSINNILCESNSEELFITAFEGVLDLVTGEFTYVNAGHDMPFICRGDSGFEPYKTKPCFVLAGMEDISYHEGRTLLSPGDKVFLYTDGVPEATNAAEEMYGLERMQRILNENREATPEVLLPIVRKDVERFVAGAPQFDDITMLCLEYREAMKLDDDSGNARISG
ncbi:MAG: PP2C family protein-serine/threonine phosphatase [Clostridiales bacterium]|nr:PP2C family protein-serine/threonine phosphatase [Clostridiales bacterium]